MLHIRISDCVPPSVLARAAEVPDERLFPAGGGFWSEPKAACGWDQDAAA